MRRIDAQARRHEWRKRRKAEQKLKTEGKKSWEIEAEQTQADLALESKQREIIAELPEPIKQFGAVVGKWIWVWYLPHFRNQVAPFFPLLKRLGFTWSRRRDAWMHSCGVESEKSRRDPRRHYPVKYLGTRPDERPSLPVGLESDCPF